jgi:hypothetical protein
LRSSKANLRWNVGVNEIRRVANDYDVHTVWAVNVRPPDEVFERI